MNTADYIFMDRAFELAEKGRGKTSPNPVVGAVLVKKGKIIGEGYHKQAGKPHAEIEALNDAKHKRNGKKIEGSTLYITLEPCCHQGRTSPCTEAIIEAGIRSVIIAIKDPNPIIAGKGMQQLNKSRIKISLAPKEYQQRAEKLNEMYTKFIRTRIPFVIQKAAISLDGKIACNTGDSKWITSPESRKYAHQLRNNCDAVLVGINTVIKDDPELTCRYGGKNSSDPLRVVIDSNLRIPLDAKMLKDTNAIIFTTDEADVEKKRKLMDKGIEVVSLNSKKEIISLRKVIEFLGKKEITSVLIEGGSEINASAIREEIIDKIVYFIAPKLIGGKEALSVIGGNGIHSMDQTIVIKNPSFKPIGTDIVVEGYI